jgi:phosphoserine phosphatase
MFQEIVQIINVRKALADIHFDTWVVFDLDNTVMTSRLALGGDSFFEGLWAHYLQKHIEPSIAIPAIMSIYNTLQDYVRTIAVETEVVNLINMLQDIGVPVIALTARGYGIRSQTLRQLADIGIDFSRNSIAEDDGICCQSGVIFCDGKDKGEKLCAMFQQIGRSPRHVVMLDDKMKHLNSMMSSLERMSINFTGLRYGYLDGQVQQFQMETAKEQLAVLLDQLPPIVQQDISKLQLLEGVQNTSTLETCAGGFFSLAPTEITIEEDTTSVQKQKLTRSMSACSFFNKMQTAELELPCVHSQPTIVTKPS